MSKDPRLGGSAGNILAGPWSPGVHDGPSFSLCRLRFIRSGFSPRSSFKLLTTEALQSSRRALTNRRCRFCGEGPATRLHPRKLSYFDVAGMFQVG